MGRRFTESEVLAMTRNRREDKALKEKLFKISEERGMYHDNLKKEKKKISQLCIESRRTSGNSPCPDCQFLCEQSDHVTQRQMQRHNKPWSVTPSESTFNVLFQKNNFAISESQKFHRRVNSVRKSRDTEAESSNQNTFSNDGDSDDRLLSNHAGNLASFYIKGPHISQIQEQPRDPSNNVSQSVKVQGNQSVDIDTYTKTLEQDANSQRSPSLIPKKPENLERKASVHTSSKGREGQQILPTKVSGNSLKRHKTVSAKPEKELKTSSSKSEKEQKTASSKSEKEQNSNGSKSGKEPKTINAKPEKEPESASTKSEKELKLAASDSENKPEKCQGDEDIDMNLGIQMQKRVLDENVCANEKYDKILTSMQDSMVDFVEQGAVVSKHLTESNERDIQENDVRMRLPIVAEAPHEDSEETREQEYMMVYTIQSENKNLNTEENAEQEGSSKRNRYVRSQTSVDERQIQIVDVALENDGTAAITLSHVEKQRPHTVAGGELVSYSEDLDLKSLTDVDHRDYLWFKGKKLHNYVKPQDRYKHDPFKMKKREKLMKKLATETPVFAEDQREQILNVELTFSKATRARLLKQLVEENSSKRQSSSSNGYEQTLNSKIEHFMKSIEDFCDKK